AALGHAGAPYSNRADGRRRHCPRGNRHWARSVAPKRHGSAGSGDELSKASSDLRAGAFTLSSRTKEARHVRSCDDEPRPPRLTEPGGARLHPTNRRTSRSLPGGPARVCAEPGGASHGTGRKAEARASARWARFEFDVREPGGSARRSQGAPALPAGSGGARLRVAGARGRSLAGSLGGRRGAGAGRVAALRRRAGAARRRRGGGPRAALARLRPPAHGGGAGDLAQAHPRDHVPRAAGRRGRGGWRLSARIRAWLPEPASRELEAGLARLARTEDVVEVVAMPDAHVSEDVCVGTVTATRRLLLPAAVGGDIGCGMATLRFDGSPELLADPRIAERILSGLQDAVPPVLRASASAALPEALERASLSAPALDACKQRDGRVEFATLGRGNHFLELSQDEQGALWLMVHSGSRALGPAIRRHHEASAQRDRSGLAYLEADGDQGLAYLADAAFAGRYAGLSRRAMVES